MTTQTADHPHNDEAHRSFGRSVLALEARMTTCEPTFRALRREKLSEQISRQLLSAITQGYYAEGNRLPPERDLADMFQTSRVAVREALMTLAAKGILNVEHGRGSTVNPRTQWNVLDAGLFMLQNGELAFEQLNEVRTILEPEMAALAAERATPEGLTAMAALIAQPHAENVEEHVEFDTSFHLEIAKASQNTVLLILMSSITDLLRESRRRTFQVAGELERAWECHRQVYDAIAAHDPVAARQAMADHMVQVREALMTLAAKGILNVEHGRGSTVNPRMHWNVLDAGLFMLQNGELAFEQLNEVRTILEPEMAALAAERATPAGLTAMAALIAQPHAENVEEHVEFDTSFHLEIAKASQNTVLLILMSSITDLLRESRRRTFQVAGELERAWACHRQVYDAIAAHDPVAARQAMADHMVQVREATARYQAAE
ncbi:MAG: FCD domain-containing protein [Anaerolineae bacterium]